MTAFTRLCILAVTIAAMLAVVVLGSMWAPEPADAQPSPTPVTTSTRVVQAPAAPEPRRTRDGASRARPNPAGAVVMGAPWPATRPSPTPTPLPTMRRAIAEASPAPMPPSTRPGTWRVANGESLSLIAQKALGSARRWPEIVAANPGIDPDRLKVGTVLKLPDASTLQEIVGTPVPTGTPGSGNTYVVKDGDSLSSIARRLLGSEDAWQSLFDANRETLRNDPDRLSVGLTLVIPTD